MVTAAHQLSPSAEAGGAKVDGGVPVGAVNLAPDTTATSFRRQRIGAHRLIVPVGGLYSDDRDTWVMGSPFDA